MRQHWLAITVGALALAACDKGADGSAAAVPGAAPGTIVVNGVTYAAQPGAAPAGAPAPAAGQPGMPGQPPAGAALPGAAGSMPTNATGGGDVPPANFFAYGRWYGSTGNCRDMANIEFTATGINIFGSDGYIKASQPAGYSAITANSFMLIEKDGARSRPIASATGDAQRITLTALAHPQTCVLTRTPPL